MPVWLPRAALISIYWDLARPVRLPLPIIHGVNDTDVSLRWIRANRVPQLLREGAPMKTFTDPNDPKNTVIHMISDVGSPQ